LYSFYTIQHKLEQKNYETHTQQIQNAKEVNSFIKQQPGVFIDVYDNFGINNKPDTLNPNYARDKIHLNPAGHQILADKVIKTAFQ
jgi:lysophospholipase L1-like esterase